MTAEVGGPEEAATTRIGVSMSRRDWIWFAVVVAGAFALRLAWFLALRGGGASHDELGYITMAERFVRTGVLGYLSAAPDAFTTPGYPVFLAAIYKVVWWIAGYGANGVTAVRFVQMLLSTATVALAFFIGARTGRKAAAFLPAIVLAIDPTSLMAQGRVLTETVFTFVFLAWVLVALLLLQRRSWGWHVAFGAALAITVLVRPVVAPLFVLPYVLDFIKRRDVRFLLGGLAALLAFAVVMSPWWVRNYTTFHKVIPFATQSGNPLLRGADPFDPYDHVGPSTINGVPEEQMTAVALARIRAGLRADPLLWIGWFTVGKWWFLWGEPWSNTVGLARLLHLVFVVFIGWPAVLIGLFDERRRFLALTVVLLTLAQMVFIPIPRYVYPLTPLVLVLAGALLADIARGEGLAPIRALRASSRPDRDRPSS
jgi:4-amino-4-deoxy-L-arabinose transferase-like glycosyltransferase